MSTSPRNLVQERALLTRDQLLDAAIRTFASAGYDASTTRQIEAAAGVKRGVIAYHFGTKENLWKAAATWMSERGSPSRTFRGTRLRFQPVSSRVNKPANDDPQVMKDLSIETLA